MNGLQGQFEPQLAALSAEHGGENYVVDSERMMQILCAKLGINRPVRESEAQKAARLAANAKKLKAAKRAARREKDKAKAEQLLKEAEAQQTQAPEYIATLKSEEDIRRPPRPRRGRRRRLRRAKPPQGRFKPRVSTAIRLRSARRRSRPRRSRASLPRATAAKRARAAAR